jgi:hypothetical protein
VGDAGASESGRVATGQVLAVLAQQRIDVDDHLPWIASLGLLAAIRGTALSAALILSEAVYLGVWADDALADTVVGWLVEREGVRPGRRRPRPAGRRRLPGRPGSSSAIGRSADARARRQAVHDLCASGSLTLGPRGRL